MKYAVIQRPSTATLGLLQRRATDPQLQARLKTGTVEAVGICQGSVLEVLVASDAAEKAADVVAGELHGSCPQHMTCLAVLGDTAAVKEALQAIRTVIAALT